MKKVNQVVLDEDDLTELADILEGVQDSLKLDSFVLLKHNIVLLVKFCVDILE